MDRRPPDAEFPATGRRWPDHVDPYRTYLHEPSPSGVSSPFRPDGWLHHFYPRSAIPAILEEIRRLFQGFKHGEICLGQHYCAPSSSWRDESVIELHHAHSSRFSTRVHLFERGGRGKAGRYLGFAALRPFSTQDLRLRRHPGFGYRYVIEAELVSPRHMLRPRYHLINTTASSARLGVLPFRSAVFMAPRFDEARRSTCVHLALSQALHLIMGRFGVRPISQREFDALLWREEQCKPTLASIAAEGANLSQALRVLRNHCNAGGFLASFEFPARPRRNPASDPARGRVLREALRCLTDTLANGLPVVMMVDYNELLPPKVSRRRPRRPRPHAALVFGMHLLHSPEELPCVLDTHGREDLDELPGRFIGHDILDGPFVEWKASTLFKAALASVDHDDLKHGIHFLALGPAQMTLGLDHVARAARRQLELCRLSGTDGFLRSYAKEYSADSRVPQADGWRYITRLVSMPEIMARYFSPGSGAREALSRTIRHSGTFARRHPGYFWCVEVRLPASGLPEHRQNTPPDTIDPAAVFAWPVDAPSEPGGSESPFLTALWAADGRYEIHLGTPLRP